MKATDIRRLERCVELYKKIEDILDKATESIDRQPKEIFFSSQLTTYDLVKEMYKSATLERSYMESKINAFKEL